MQTLDDRTLVNISTDGWCAISTALSSVEELSAAVRASAEKLGVIGPGRFGQAVERVEPQSAEDAFSGSLSETYGLASLPLHTDTAHWPVPCRYLVLACADVGPSPTPTALLKVSDVDATREEAETCETSPFLIRNGRRSFYGVIKDRDRPFVRVDPGCMFPTSPSGKVALGLFSAGRNRAKLHLHDWRVGDILIIDNWRVVHGRGAGHATQRGRILLRSLVQ